MGLNKTRHEIGTSHFAHERAAVQLLVDGLPDRAPYHLLALKELVTPDGRRYEIDALVVTPRALFLVEIKGHPAHFKGDAVDWRVEWKDGRLPITIENPVRLANAKARVLASALERKLGAADRPFVQALVFLSDERASIDSNHNADHCVVTRHNVFKALTEGVFPGATPKLATNVIDTPRGQRVVDALRALGLRNPKEQNAVAGYVLGDLLDEGHGWQDYAADAEQVKGRVARVRLYAVPTAISRERREQLVRAALREAEVLNALSDHPHVLHLQTSLADGPGGAPCLLFDRHADELDLETFLRRSPTLPFGRQVEIVEQIGNALAFCHRKGVLHRGLDPSAVLVRYVGDSALPDAERPLSVRLLNFQFASHEGVTSGTHHLSAFSADRHLVYRAPEVLQDARHATTASDVFSLGAIAYRVFTGRSPGASLADRELLMRAGHLSLAAASEGLGAPARGSGTLVAQGPGSLDELVANVTDVDAMERTFSANDFVGFLLDVATRGDADAPSADPDPLEARPGDVLAGNLRVVQFLGSGATAKVFRVERDGQTYALKVALDGENDQRLAQEATVLERFRSDRIVALHARLTLGGRQALLLDDAGESLAELLAREGAQSLDYARRWGEDLLLALEAIEGVVQHRDLKPANVGVLEPGSKKKRHLKLFDFSLSALDPEQVTAGTPAYRDPFLATRGRWDESADRYAAAVSLHEMLTGLRPRWGTGDGPVRPADVLTLDAERFDAAVRDRLVAFFRLALDRSADARFPSAEAMRFAWSACFVAPAVAPAAPGDDTPAPLSDAALAALRPDSALEAMGLSARARNALDRSGIVTASQLARVSDNLLSSIRGIGRDTAREIHELRRRLEALPALAAIDEPAFDPGFVGDDLALDAVKIPDGLRKSLDDAGLRGLADVAAAPASQVERLARAHGADALTKLRAALKEARDATERTADPRTVEAWLDALFDPRQRHENQKANYQQTVWRWMGLDPKVPVEPGDSLRLSEHLGCTRQNISLMLGKARGRWAGHAKIGELLDRVRAAVDALDGVARIDRVGEGLVVQLPHEAGQEGAPLASRRAECLVAVACDLADDLVMERDHGRHRWVARDRAAFAPVRALGPLADELAGRSPLPSSAEVQEALGAVVRDTPLAAVPTDRLVALAADASDGAARSARLELYPRGMLARRALELCHAALTSEREGVAESELRATVLARYPEAEALPARPALDALVAEALQLVWDDGAQRWRRPVEDPSQQSHPSETAPDVRPTALPGARAARRSPDAQDAWDFDDALKVAARNGDWRVFTTAPNLAPTVTARVAERLGTTARSLDAALLAEIDAVAAEKRVKPDAVIAADREGPAGKNWRVLRKLVDEAAARVTARWTAERDPLVLGDLGLAARFELGGLLQALLDATRRDEGRAVFLVVPRYGDEAGVSVSGGALPSLPVPVYSPAQRVEVPRAWVENRHRGAD